MAEQYWPTAHTNIIHCELYMTLVAKRQQISSLFNTMPNVKVGKVMVVRCSNVWKVDCPRQLILPCTYTHIIIFIPYITYILYIYLIIADNYSQVTYVLRDLPSLITSRPSDVFWLFIRSHFGDHKWELLRRASQVCFKKWHLRWDFLLYQKLARWL